MLCPVRSGWQQHEVVDPVVSLVVILVVHVHPVRDGPNLPGPHPPVQESASAVPVVRIPCTRVPPDSVVLDRLAVSSHVNTVSVVRTNDACCHPRCSVHTSWSSVSQVNPAACSNLRTDRSPLSQVRRTRRNPFRVHTRSPTRTSWIGTSPCSVRTSAPSRTHRFPPARKRSTSSGLFAPNSFASDPLGHSTVRPPGLLTMVAVGSCALIPDGPEKQAVAASPSVGAMIPIQCGCGPGRQAGPRTCSAMWCAQASVLPAMRPASSSQPYGSPEGRTWCGSGCQRGENRSAARMAKCACALSDHCRSRSAM